MKNNSLEPKPTSPASTGTSFMGVMLANFITLKLAGLVTWSWVTVFAPLWIHIFILLLGAALGHTALALLERINKGR